MLKGWIQNGTSIPRKPWLSVLVKAHFKSVSVCLPSLFFLETVSTGQILLYLLPYWCFNVINITNKILPRKGYIRIEHKIHPCFPEAGVCVSLSMHSSTAIPQPSIPGAQIVHLSRTFQLSFQFQAVLVGCFFFWKLLQGAVWAGPWLPLPASQHYPS